MTKRQALIKLRTDPTYRICPYADYMRLVNHLKHQVEYVQVTVKGAMPITAVKHNEHFYIPCFDDAVTNCYYDPEKVKH